MGSETKLCPCGCKGPLTERRLAAHGAFTVLVSRPHPRRADKLVLTLRTCKEVASLLGSAARHPWDAL
eukprot:3875788-Prorocentrum_lima.AAC.1